MFFRYVNETDLEILYPSLGGFHYYFHKPGDRYPVGSLALDEDVYFYIPDKEGYVRYHAEDNGRVFMGDGLVIIEVTDGMNIGSDIPTT